MEDNFERGQNQDFEMQSQDFEVYYHTDSVIRFKSGESQYMIHRFRMEGEYHISIYEETEEDDVFILDMQTETELPTNDRDIKEWIGDSILKWAHNLSSVYNNTAPKSEVFIEERGWPGHHGLYDNLDFRRNTLVSKGDARYVVSTIGMQTAKWNDYDGLDTHRYFETMVAKAIFYNGNWEFDDNNVVEDMKNGDLWWEYKINEKEMESCVAEAKANETHDGIVLSVVKMLETGEWK